jgi:AraC family transcriptional regulator of adaptative response/methylated-DNA-[protein]-cysteine methyltransferase
MGMPTSHSDRAVLQALEILDARRDENLCLAELAAAVGASPFHLQRRFKQHTGMTPKEYTRALRFAHLRGSLREGRAIAGATYEAGFGSSRALYEKTATDLGMTPGQYARRGAGLALSVHVGSCSLGLVLIAATTSGVCAVLLGDREEDLRDELAREFPRATLDGGDVPDAWAQAVLAHLDDSRLPLGVPLDHHGTPFQVRVWKALREIPSGERRSYAEVAAAIGSPRAVRAVGAACARNVIAVLVPCHRVVRQDGATGRYRWGTARKQALLERESAADGA